MGADNQSGGSSGFAAENHGSALSSFDLAAQLSASSFDTMIAFGKELNPGGAGSLSYAGYAFSGVFFAAGIGVGYYTEGFPGAEKGRLAGPAPSQEQSFLVVTVEGWSGRWPCRYVCRRHYWRFCWHRTNADILTTLP